MGKSGRRKCQEETGCKGVRSCTAWWAAVNTLPFYSERSKVGYRRVLCPDFRVTCLSCKGTEEKQGQKQRDQLGRLNCSRKGCWWLRLG